MSPVPETTREEIIAALLKEYWEVTVRKKEIRDTLQARFGVFP